MESVSLSDHVASQSQMVRILLVDDREDHFIMTRRIFASIQRGQFTVDWAGKYTGALEAIQQGRPDVYLIDYHLGALRKSEEALRRSEEQLRLAVDAAAMGTIDWDIDSNQISYGGSFERLFDLQPGSPPLSFKSLLQQVHPQDRATLEEAISSAMVDGN